MKRHTTLTAGAARLLLALLFLLPTVLSAQTDGRGLLSGRVTDSEGRIVAEAVVSLKSTAQTVRTDAQGLYHINAPAGRYVVRVRALGYAAAEERVTIVADGRTQANFRLRATDRSLSEAVVTSSSVRRINTSAYNVVATDARRLHNSALQLSDAVGRLPGMKLRETGGVGSDMQLSLDGFTGRHVRVFIDGVPQEGVGQAFGLNNIPINFAERIEVYRGVVPVEFGTDALGGVINIVTGQNRRPWWLDASYSVGSFATHRSNVRFGQNFRGGWTYDITAFQNYSANTYKVDTKVKEYRDTDGDGRYDVAQYTTDERRVRRFNDTYHNEAVVGRVGITGRRWADRLFFSMTYSHLYKEIQNGVRQEIVFGQKHRRGYTLMPALDYYNRHFLTRGLDLRLAANYNHNVMTNIDTSAWEYNWYGQRKYRGTLGEQAYLNNEQRNRNATASLTMNYRMGGRHRLTLTNVFAAFRRDTRSYVDASNQATDYSMPKVTRKDVLGLAYTVTPSRLWNGTVFGKFYHQYNSGPISQNADGVGNYIAANRTTSTPGFGAALTAFPLKGLQAKLSYERAVRLPSTDELFGDEDLEAGRTDLKAERSDNMNLNLSYGIEHRRHAVYVEGGLIYRMTRDFIRRGIVKGSGSTQFGVYENFGRVLTKGFNVSARYNYGRYVNLGVTYNAIDARDDERYLYGGSLQPNLHYRDRIPNQPYRFANFDASFTLPALLSGTDALTLSYDSYWQHDFPLNWESISAADSKRRVPEQWAHNVSLTYTFCNGRYNVSMECRNLTDARLYDNYSLQKPGRAVYAKFRVNLGGR